MVHPDTVILIKEQLNLTIAVDTVVTLISSTNQLFSSFMFVLFRSLQRGIISAFGYFYFFTELLDTKAVTKFVDEPLFLWYTSAFVMANHFFRTAFSNSNRFT